MLGRAAMPALFTKPIESLTAEDAKAVIGWPESLTVEFKQTLPGRNGRPDPWLAGKDFEPYARDKLFKEVVAFANTSGGHLVLGVDQTKDAPPLAAALTPVPRCVDLAERLGRAAQAIDPPIPLLLVRGIPLQGDAGVAVFRVPASRAAPHRGPDKECYVRRGTESKPVGMREIQDMTLAAGRREELVDALFARAARQFAEWFATAMGGQPRAAGFRVTAVPVGARFDLGRLYGRDDDLTRLQLPLRYPVTVDGLPTEAIAMRVPERAQPIVRGVRRTHGDDEVIRVYLDAHSNGVVDLGFRIVPNADAQRRAVGLALGWVVAHAVNVLRTADALRTAAGAPDCEYGIEVEVRGEPARDPIGLIDFCEQSRLSGIGLGLRGLPLLLPRVSFGPLGELDQVVSIIATDLCDATEALRPQLMSLRVVLPHV